MCSGSDAFLYQEAQQLPSTQLSNRISKFRYHTIFQHNMHTMLTVCNEYKSTEPIEVSQLTVGIKPGR